MKMGKEKLFEMMEKINPDFKKNNIIKESYVFSDENLIFNQRLNNSYFNNYDTFTNDYDLDITESDIIISWKLAFSLNEYGISNMIINVKNIDGYYNIKYFNKQSDALEQEQQKNIKDIKWKFIIEDVTLSIGRGLYIESLDFDFSNNTCKINFSN